MKDLVKLIKNRFAARNFCTSFTVDGQNFDLCVEGLGSVKLPIQPKIAKQLISCSTPSKFGFKQETLYDPTVRKSFEIAAKKIKLGPIFQKNMDESLEKIKKELLFPETSILKAELHNMLIYEKGCFFEFHQDSEKKEGMVASIVVVLPSNYRGGELVIEYQGHRKVLSGYGHCQNGLKNDPLTTFVSFYADCLHSVQKVTYGYRIALTFNLILENPQELEHDKKQTEAVSALKQYFETKEDLPSYRRDEPKWFVYFLNHQYTMKSLDWKLLKGVDKESAATLKAVAQELELDLYLAQADIQETWDVLDDDYDDWRNFKGRSHRNRHHAVEPEPSEIINNETVLSNWLDKDGKICDFTGHYIHESMIFMSKENSKYKPESSEYEGYMGNYGNTLDRWYKRTAIVLWPKHNNLESKFAIDPNMGIKEVIKLIKADANSGSIAYKSIRKLLQTHHIISNIDIEYLIDLAILLNASEHLYEIFSHCTLEKMLSVNTKKMSGLLAHFGDSTVSKAFLMLKESSNGGEGMMKNYYGMITSIHQHPLTTEKLLNSWLKNLKIYLAIKNQEANSVEYRDRYIKNTQKILVMLVKALHKINEESKVEGIFKILYKNKEMLGETYFYEIFHHTELVKNFGVLAEYKSFKEKILQKMVLILNNPLSDSDFTIDELPKCPCELCVTLKEFLSSDSMNEKIWPISKEKRQHVHNVIDQLKLPISHNTLRRGSPYQLILKKNGDLLPWRESRYDRLRKLIKLPC